MTGKAQKLLDILSFGLYNTRINKNKGNKSEINYETFGEKNS